MPGRISRRRNRSLHPKRRDPITRTSVSRDRYIECTPSLLVEIKEAALGKYSRGVRFQFEMGAKAFRDFAGNHARAGCVPDHEIYGVLLGRRDSPSLRIMAFRWLDPASTQIGPDALPDEQQQAFAGLMAKLRWDPKLSGLQPVGWFRARSRADLSLSLQDIDIFDGFFKESWQIGLVVQTGTPITARFFVRELDRTAQLQTGFRDIVVGQDSPPRVVVERVARRTSSDPSLGLPRTETKPLPPLRRAFAWIPGVILAAALSFGAWWIMRPPQDPSATTHNPNKSSTPSRNSSAAAQADAIWKKWQQEINQQAEGVPAPDGSAEPFLGSRATPEPESQPTDATPLVPPDNSPSPADPADTNRVLPPKPSDRSVQSRREAESLRAEDPLLKKERPVSQAERLSIPALPPTSTNHPLAVADPTASSGTSPRANAWAGPRTPESTRQQSPAPAVSREPGQQANLPIPSSPISLPASASSPSVSPMPPPGPLSPPTSPRTPTPQVTNPTSTAPSALPTLPSGRLIWTVRPRKNELLTFDGNEISAGSVSGALPGRPIELTVSPGALTKNGIVIYTPHFRSKDSAEEPPGPQNGWNKTTFEWAPDRATDIEVVEAPGPSNGWKRLVLRSRSSRYSIILVEWRATS